MRKLLAIALAVVAVGVAVPAAAQTTYEIRLTNLTRGQIMSPAVIATHTNEVRMFKVGKKASEAMAAVAEDADASALMAALDGAGAAVTDWLIADGVLPPGETRSFEIDVADGDLLSLVSMLVTTNDAFAGLDSYDLSGLSGQRKSFTVPAYDAGSEENNESCEYIPGPPCGSGGARMPKGREGVVHIHAGIHGVGDLLPAMHDWRNPVLLIEILPVR